VLAALAAGNALHEQAGILVDQDTHDSLRSSAIGSRESAMGIRADNGGRITIADCRLPIARGSPLRRPSSPLRRGRRR
jgi:hypothetical protein